MSTPIIDLFAGPGGLGEGFSALQNSNGKRLFKIALSVEKEFFAHQTLTLRSFFRQFDTNKVPNDYYSLLKGNLSIDELYKKWPKEAEHARNEAWNATLGEELIANGELDNRITKALKGSKNWLLIGGPPCQAYSIVGRSRRQETMLDEKKDIRVGLYKQYLRILAVHNPAVFVMENVKGILSAETEESPVFSKILNDLSDPLKAHKIDYPQEKRNLVCPGYKIYSLVAKPKKFDVESNPVYDHKDFIIQSENFGIPQTRHRVILLGVRKDIDFVPEILEQTKEISISKVLSDLPRLRGGLSKLTDNNDTWKNIILQIQRRNLLSGVTPEVREEILKQVEQIKIPQQGVGSLYIATNAIKSEYRSDWFSDSRIEGICNHNARGHMESDLHRYFFVSCFGKIKKRSPKLEDFPVALLPNHANINEGIENRKFADRFRVQLYNKPSKTITSHISKDGHYYIHPDATQCRSFTVREAARIQTFPDNYFFCGPRTAQFIQVGNAVPPLLAFQIAKIVSKGF